MTGGADGADGVPSSGGADAPKLDPSSPYFIGSHDGPGNVITPIVFRGDNYEEWCRSIRLSLMARRKFELVEGTISKPTDEQGLRDRPDKAALAACQQPKTMSIAEYFGKLQPLWDELATYNPLPFCACGGCKCNIAALLQACLDEDRLQDFLYGVNVELYRNMCSSILSQEPLPSLDRAYQMFLQEDRLQLASKAKLDREDIHAMAVKFGASVQAKPRFDGDKSALQCTYCERRAHDEKNCWFKHVYSEWWEHRVPRGGGRGSRGARNGRRSAGQSGGRSGGRGDISVAAVTCGSGSVAGGSSVG
ncbi:hypothetical protein BVRB_8g201040 [Beta vulgaris subsp. vulgaris]|uniref:Retrotransposon Copia-like N-terminal domain-containing protein n=1 Tax=Beta vulgaris subsp. vulgaris TaxID=3555 RepID=A0A0J8B6M4_BETVV|nr:hypothetical protein BVRB_8g201040 [Beta vulgaris subsp. vulgaris]